VNCLVFRKQNTPRISAMRLVEIDAAPIPAFNRIERERLVVELGRGGRFVRQLYPVLHCLGNKELSGKRRDKCREREGFKFNSFSVGVGGGATKRNLLMTTEGVIISCDGQKCRLRKRSNPSESRQRKVESALLGETRKVSSYPV